MLDLYILIDPVLIDRPEVPITSIMSFHLSARCYVNLTKTATINFEMSDVNSDLQVLEFFVLVEKFWRQNFIFVSILFSTSIDTFFEKTQS